MRLRYFSLGVLISVIIFIIVNIFIVMSRDEEIVIKDVANYDSSMELINKRIEKLKDSDCKEKLKELSDNIDGTYFKENTTVNKYYHAYFDNETFLNLYGEVMDVCNIPEDDSLYVLALASYSFPSSIKSKYNLRHEFRISDAFTRNDVKSEEYEVGSYSTKVLELKVMDELLGRVK